MAYSAGWVLRAWGGRPSLKTRATEPTLCSSPQSPVFISAPHPPTQPSLYHGGASMTLFGTLPTWLHPQKSFSKRLSLLSAPKPYPLTVLTLLALASVCAILCRIRCPTLQRHPWGSGTMTCPMSLCQLKEKKRLKHSVCRGCRVQEVQGCRDEHEHGKPRRRGYGVFASDLKQYSFIISHKFGGRESGQLIHSY